MNEQHLVCLVCVAIVFFFGAWILVGYLKKKEHKKLPEATLKENYSPSPNFRVFNYFPNNPIRVDLLIKKGEASEVPHGLTGGSYLQKTLIEKIAPQKSGGIPRNLVLQDLVEGSIFKIYVLDPTGKTAPREFGTSEIKTNAWERIKNLHVGMITTRFIGTTDTLRMTTTAGNAVNGNAYLVIHNLTELPLRLNDGDIEVPAHGTTRFQGYRHQGITLGYYFNDDDGLYPQYQYLEPFSDLYYGVVSDISQPINGCWQTEYNDQCDYGQTLWPFREGVF